MELDTVFRPELVDPSAFLAPGAIVLGNVTLGADASIWFQAVVRGDSEAIQIGSRTNVQDGAILHADPGYPCKLGNDVTVGHAAVVHGTTVEDEVLIGMGAIILNGARIGRHSIIGAGAVVTEGTIIPPGSLVLGLPGKIIRPTTPADLERIHHAAAHYVSAAKVYRESKPSLK